MDYSKAVTTIKNGGIVVFPTESWYGVGVDPWNEKALQRLYTIKQRPTDKPVLVLIGANRQLDSLITSVPDLYPPLMKKFWPGPLTLVFPAHPSLPELLTSGTGTVAVRFSSHPLAAELALQSGPITGTSANLSGENPHCTSHGVAAELGDKVDLVVDGGKTQGGKGSTIVGVDGDKLVCIRAGQVPFSRIIESCNP
jgi:L-threonylcarbamoyladenylate synthase